MADLSYQPHFDLAPVAMPAAVRVSDYPPHAFNHTRKVDTYAIRAESLHQATLDVQRLLIMPNGATILRIISRPVLDQALRQIVEDIVGEQSSAFTRAIVWVPPRDPTYHTKYGFAVYWAPQPSKKYETVTEYLERCKGIHAPLPNQVVKIRSAADIEDLKIAKPPGRDLPELVLAADAEPTLWRTLWNMQETRADDLLAVNVAAPPTPYPVVALPGSLKVVAASIDITSKWRFFPDKWGWILSQARAAIDPTDTVAAAEAAKNVDAWIRGCIPRWIYAHPDPNMRQRVLYLGDSVPASIWHDIAPDADKTGPSPMPTQTHLRTGTKFFVVVKKDGVYTLDPIAFLSVDPGWQGVSGPSSLYFTARGSAIQERASNILVLVSALTASQKAIMAKEKKDLWVDLSADMHDPTRQTAAANVTKAYTTWQSTYEDHIIKLLRRSTNAINDYPQNKQSLGPIDSTALRSQAQGTLQKQLEDTSQGQSFWENMGATGALGITFAAAAAAPYLVGYFIS
jgi:hypothetical protein